MFRDRASYMPQNKLTHKAMADIRNSQRHMDPNTELRVEYTRMLWHDIWNIFVRTKLVRIFGNKTLLLYLLFCEAKNKTFSVPQGCKNII
jgi:hypothetical protein